MIVIKKVQIDLEIVLVVYYRKFRNMLKESRRKEVIKGEILINL